MRVGEHKLESASIAPAHEPGHVLPDRHTLDAQVFVLDLISLALARVPGFATGHGIEARAEILYVMHQLMQQNRARLGVAAEVERLLDEHALTAKIEGFDRTSPRAHPRLKLLERQNVNVGKNGGHGVPGDGLNGAEQFKQQRHQRLIAHRRLLSDIARADATTAALMRRATTRLQL